MGTEDSQTLTTAHGDRGAKFEATRESGPHEGDRRGARGVRVWRLELQFNCARMAFTDLQLLRLS